MTPRRRPSPRAVMVVDQFIDFLLCIHVDPTSRLVQQQNLGLGRHPFGENHFLLIPTAEIPHALTCRRAS